jgi:predicted nucleic acid-binding protein
MANDSTVFVDTNVLIYAQDPRDAGKREQAGAWLRTCWQNHRGRISSQVLHELYANLRRAAPGLSEADSRALVRRYRAWTPWLVDDATVEQAWDIRDRFDIGYRDALMLAAAQLQGCELFLTEDLQHDQRIDRLRIVNPFKLRPDALGLGSPTP